MRGDVYDTNTRDIAVQALSRIESHEDQCTLRYTELSNTIGILFKSVDNTKDSVSSLDSRILTMLLLGSASFIVFLLGIGIDVFMRIHGK